MTVKTRLALVQPVQSTT